MADGEQMKGNSWTDQIRDDFWSVVAWLVTDSNPEPLDFYPDDDLYSLSDADEWDADPESTQQQDDHHYSEWCEQDYHDHHDYDIDYHIDFH